MINIFISLLLCPLPNIIKRAIYNQLLGHEIDKTARIGFSIIRVKKLKMAEYSRIKSFSVLKGMDYVEMGSYSSIGTFNRFTAASTDNKNLFVDEKDRFPALIIGEHSSIVSKHYFDCNNTIKIGSFTTIAGMGTSFWTHGINIRDNKQETRSIEVGDFCLIGAQSVVVKGAKLPSYCVLGANSTLHKAHENTHMLYSGVPAVSIMKFDENSKYFHREHGSVN